MRIHVRLGTVIACLLLATAACAAPIGHAGRWLLAPDGRVLVIHGVNMPSKTLPAYPAALGFGDDDAAALAGLGFNAVRLTVERYAVEPAPGEFDDAYIQRFADTIRTLSAHGILSLIDFHQDEFGPVFYDNGFPDWMTQTDGLPNAYEVGFPAQYVANPALNRAFDHLWANDPDARGRGLQDDDAELLARVAAHLEDAPGLLGFEVINEPWPGSTYAACFNLAIGCPAFDQGPLSAYYRRAISAIRAQDPEHLIFYEPLVSFNYGVPTNVVPPKDSRLGFAFHDYGVCSATSDGGLPVSVGSACRPEDQLVLDHAEQHSAATGSALLETEFGATTDTQALETELAQYDGARMPWMFWSYTHYIDGLNPDGSLKPATDGNLDQAMTRTLARPYPQLVAGTPTQWSFDPQNKRFRLSYTTRRAGGRGRFPAGAQTVVAMPRVQYPNGYDATVSGGRIVSAPDATQLIIASRRGARSVALTVNSAG